MRPGSAQALSDALDGFAAAPQQLTSWGLAVYERVQRDYTPARMVDRTLELYGRIARR
jgi:glycosyltransferase involved in cell wall biosynthesis